jgi:hypothetical protein
MALSEEARYQIRRGERLAFRCKAPRERSDRGACQLQPSEFGSDRLFAELLLKEVREILG